MRFSLEIPSSATLRAGKEAYARVPAGTRLHRIHPVQFAGDQFNPTASGNARFSPIRDTAGAIIPTIYAAQSFDCAACEIILRCPDTPAPLPSAMAALPDVVHPIDFAGYCHSELDTTVDLNLVDLTIAGQRKLGVNHNFLLAGPKSTYPATRSWAEAIHEGCPQAQGLYYSSYQLGPQYAVLLFGDRVPPRVLATVGTRAVAASPCHKELLALGTSLSIEYVDF